MSYFDINITSIVFLAFSSSFLKAFMMSISIVRQYFKLMQQLMQSKISASVQTDVLHLDMKTLKIFSLCFLNFF